MKNAVWARGVGLGVLLVMVLFLLQGCAAEEYGPCTLPRSEALDEACKVSSDGSGATNAASCSVDFVFECESQLCGIFQGSDAFCTYRCVPERENPAECCNPLDTNECGPLFCVGGGEGTKECPKGGRCLEWVPGIGEFLCVPKENLPGAR